MSTKQWLGHVEVDRGYETPCWVWLGRVNNDGYAQVERYGRRVLLHRWMYEQHVGPIPEGLTIDHLCRQRDCGNPAHLEAVTVAENIRRGLPYRPNHRAAGTLNTHCPHGHAFTAENTKWCTNGARQCRTCQLDQQRARRARKRHAALPAA